MDDHIAKPVEPAALFATLLRWWPEAEAGPGPGPEPAVRRAAPAEDAAF